MAISKDNTPLRTDNVSGCNTLIIRSAGTKPFSMLVHVMNSVLDDNEFGNQGKDIIDTMGPGAQIIAVNGTRSFGNGNGNLRELAYGGLLPQKRITVDSGRSVINVAYDPITNEDGILK